MEDKTQPLVFNAMKYSQLNANANNTNTANASSLLPWKGTLLSSLYLTAYIHSI